MPATLGSKLVAEFFGTFILVTTVCTAIMSTSPLASISIACSLMVGIYSLGNVSGANFNPAVSTGLFFSNMMGHSGLKDFDIKLTGAYKVVQVIAGLCAALFAGLIYGCTVGGSASNAGLVDTAAPLTLANSFPTLGADNGYAMWSKLVAEVFYTCLLVFVVLNTATNPTKGETGNHYFGLSIGFVIMAGANAIGHISGCSLNPAVSFGLAMGSIIFGSMSADVAFVNFLLYALAEVFGSLIAAGLFSVVRSANLKKRNDGKSKTPPESLGSKCIAEFTGAFYLILTVCLVCSSPAPPVLGVVGIASSLMVMIYSLGAVSGANFNPAVSLGLGMRGELAWGDAGAYIVSQLCGGLFAAGMASVLEAGNPAGGYNIALVATTPSIDGITVIAGKGTWGQIVLAEYFYTFLLVLVVLNAAVVNGPNNYFGLAIGMCVTVGGIAVGGISGGCFNPAVSFALGMGGLWAKGTGAQNAWFFVYWIAQFLGAATAAGVTNATQGFDETLDDADGEDEELMG